MERELGIIVVWMAIAALLIAIALGVIEQRRKKQRRKDDLRQRMDVSLLRAQMVLPAKHLPTVYEHRIVLPEENDAFLARVNKCRVNIERPEMGLRPFLFIRSQYGSCQRPKLDGETLLHYIVDYGYTKDTLPVVKAIDTLQTWKEPT